MLYCFWVIFPWAVICNAAPVSESKIKCFLVKYPAIEYTILIIWKVLMVLFNNRFFLNSRSPFSNTGLYWKGNRKHCVYGNRFTPAATMRDKSVDTLP